MNSSKWHAALAEIFPVRGWYLQGYKKLQDPDADFDEHVFDLWKAEKGTRIELYAPRPNVSGVYEVDGTHKVLVLDGVRGADFCRQPNAAQGILVRSTERILAGAMRTALAKGLFDVIDVGRMQHALDAFYGSSPLLRQVNPWNTLQVRMTKDVVHIDLGSTLDPRDRLVSDWPGKIDLLSTPQGDRILQTHQLARGASVDGDGRLTQGKSPFSASMESCLIFPENTRANRLIGARSAMEHRETIVDGEQPWVRHHKYEEHDLYGIHLTTAIMAHDVNFEDCAAISPQAAARMLCYKYKLFTAADVLDVTPVVGVGDRVGVGSMLIRVTDDEGSEMRKTLLDDPLFKEVFMVEHCRTRVAGKPGTKAKVTVFGLLRLEDGSKIVTRSGNKAVARIVQNMPRAADGRRIDVAIHPKSVAKRRCFGLLREMALNRMCEARGGEVLRVKHFSDEHSLEQLAATDWGQNTKMEDGSEVFVGPVYWLRTDKHARDMLSWVGSDKAVDSRGLNPDSGKSGGQRLGQDIQTVLSARGWQDAADALVARNTEPAAMDVVRSLAEALHDDV